MMGCDKLNLTQSIKTKESIFMNWTTDQLRVFPVAFGFIILVSIALSLLLKNKSPKLKNLPFQIITIVLIIAEITKQIRAMDGAYSLWNIPLHYCSMFMFWFLLASFTKGKVKEIGHKVSLLMGIGFLLGFMYDATTIIGGSAGNLTFAWNNFGNLHTFYYHFTVILFLALQVGLKQSSISLKDFKTISIPFFTWMAITTVFANVLNTNFTNLLYNNITFMDLIRLNYGYPIYLTSMFLSFFIILTSILTVSSLIKIWLSKILHKKNSN
jgi:hypothetical protein